MHFILRDWYQTFVLPKPFSPPERESAFLHYYACRYGRVRISSAALGVGTWLGYFIADYALCQLDPIFATAYERQFLIHAAGSFVLVLFFLFCLLYGDFPTDEQRASRTVLGGSFAAAFFILLKQFAAPSPYEYLYYAQGTIVLLIFCFGLFRLRARDIDMMICNVTVLQLLLIWYRTLSNTAPDITHAGEAYALLSSLMILTIGIIGHGIGVQFERTERQTFITEHDLQEINQALNQRNDEVIRLKTESEQQLRTLLDTQARLREEAEQRNRDKSRFLASAVHDLRQPLQAISNALHPAQLAMDQADHSRAAEMLKLVQAAADTMRKQLSAILNLSRLESGLIKAELSEFELNRLIDSVVQQQRPVAEACQVHLSYPEMLGNGIFVRSDPAFIERILLNLIGNGIKYRAPGRRAPEVSVQVTADATQVRIDVIDNGLGIAPEHLAQQSIFEPFFQANNTHPESEKGVGLGLSIVRAMIGNLPGHQVSVCSDLNRGSTFSLSLPRAKSRARLSDEAPSLKAPALTCHLERCYVILVEDDPLVRQSTTALFKAEGIRHEAYDSYEQLEMSLQGLERDPDIILSDFRLPNKKTAIDVLALARNNFPDIGAVVFSGEVGLHESYADLPETTFIAKPLAPGELLRAIAGVCARTRPSSVGAHAPTLEVANDHSHSIVAGGLPETS